MNQIENRQKQAKILRLFRKIHRLTGIFLFIFFLIIGLTGLLLGWKKNSGGLILADTASGTTTDLSQWKALYQLTHAGVNYLRDSVSASLDTTIDRIDVRPDKGIVKISFKQHYTGLQVDGATAKVIQIEMRNADLIEQIHEGSWVDRQLGWQKGYFKLFYTSVCGMGMVIFSITGFWLWYGPKKMRN